MAIDYGELARAAASSTSARVFLQVGGGVLLLSLLLNVGLEIWKTSTGLQDKADYFGSIARVAIFGAILSAYPSIVTNIAYTINSLGTFDTASAGVEDLFLKRAFAFQEYIQKSTVEDSGTGFSIFDINKFRLGMLQFVTWLSFLFSLAIVYVLKHLQTFMLAVTINYGPLLIGAASVGGIFGNLALAWFWAFVELACWGVTMNILLQTLSTVPIELTNGVPEMWTEITVNVVYAICLLSVPAITSSLIRGLPMASIGQKGTMLAAAAITMATAKSSAAYTSLANGGGKLAYDKIMSRVRGGDPSSGGGTKASSGGTHTASGGSTSGRGDGGSGRSSAGGAGEKNVERAKSQRKNAAIQAAMKKRKGD